MFGMLHLQNIVKWRYETIQIEAAFDDSTSWINWKDPDFFHKKEYLKQKKAFTTPLSWNEKLIKPSY